MTNKPWNKGNTTKLLFFFILMQQYDISLYFFMKCYFFKACYLKTNKKYDEDSLNKSFFCYFCIFFCFLAAISWYSFVFRFFAITSGKIFRLSSNFNSSCILIISFKNYNKLFEIYKYTIVLRDYRFTLLFKYKFFCLRFGP